MRRKPPSFSDVALIRRLEALPSAATPGQSSHLQLGNGFVISATDETELVLRKACTPLRAASAAVLSDEGVLDCCTGGSRHTREG